MLIFKGKKLIKGSQKKSILRILFLPCLAIFWILATQSAQAASTYFNPSTGKYPVGKSFKVDILVNTEGESINNAEATMTFPKDLLEITSVAKSGSIFTLWVEEPVFSNKTGTLSFSGGLPTPGFKGKTGKILGIVFKVKKAGAASLIFSSSAVRANDGLGTDVLKTRGKAQFILGDQNLKIKEDADAKILPSAPKVLSSTHPDQNKWYNNPNPKFSWSVPPDVTSVRLLYDKVPNSTPIVVYTPPIADKALSNLKTGTYYLHVQFKNTNGWGEISHYKFQTDTEKPSSLNIIEIPKEDFTKAKFVFEAKDELSGMDHFDVQVNGVETAAWIAVGVYEFETQSLKPGEYIINVKAVDKAGNALSNSSVFTIEPVQSAKTTDWVDAANASDPQNPPLDNFVMPSILQGNEKQVGYIAIIVSLITFVVGLLCIIWHGWLLRLRYKRKVREAALHKVFDIFNEDLRKQVKLLERTRTKRQLTPEEEKVLKQLTLDLDHLKSL